MINRKIFCGPRDFWEPCDTEYWFDLEKIRLKSCLQKMLISETYWLFPLLLLLCTSYTWYNNRQDRQTSRQTHRKYSLFCILFHATYTYYRPVNCLSKGMCKTAAVPKRQSRRKCVGTLSPLPSLILCGYQFQKWPAYMKKTPQKKNPALVQRYNLKYTTNIGNESAPTQLAQCWFPAMGSPFPMLKY